MVEESESALSALAAEPIDDYDLALLRELAAAYEAADPVPDGLVDRTKFGVTLEALNAEIARLERSASLSGARGERSNEVQTVTFTSQSLTTMVTITPAGGERVRIDGWIAPGGGVSVQLRTASERFEMRADSDGRFVFEDVPRGLSQFILRIPGSADRPAVVTPSIEL